MIKLETKIKMLKRINKTFSTANRDEIYVPMEQEIMNPDKSMEEIFKDIEFENSFKGMH